MKLDKRVIDELAVRPGHAAGLGDRSTNDTKTPWLGHAGAPSERDLADHDLEAFRDELESAQELLYASGTYAVLVIFQALDAAGKDGTIKHVMSGVNPQGCEVVSFKAPSSDDLSHDFLWRATKALPARGRIGIFNRSYYEDVLVTRVHPDLLVPQHLPPGTKPDEKFWNRRYKAINAFEQHLEREGTRVVKFFLHVSKDEQKARLLDRLDDPTKHWKFSSADLAERAYFEDYQRVYEQAITATSTSSAPWFVIPADRKPAMRALVGGVLVHVIEQLDPKPPKVSKDGLAAIDAARKALLAE